jgi:hypothetical protein
MSLEAEAQLALCRSMREVCFHTTRSLQLSRQFFETLAPKVVTMPLSRYFKQEQLARVFLCFDLEEDVRLLRAAGLLTRDDPATGVVSFLLDNTVVATVDPREDSIVTQHLLERDLQAAAKTVRRRGREHRDRERLLR